MLSDLFLVGDVGISLFYGIVLIFAKYVGADTSSSMYAPGPGLTSF
jgi:hypothetical protein